MSVAWTQECPPQMTQEVRRFGGPTEAARHAGVSRRTVVSLIEGGYVTQLKLPGRPPLVDLEDVKRIIQESLVPGRRPSSGGNDEGRPSA